MFPVMQFLKNAYEAQASDSVIHQMPAKESTSPLTNKFCYWSHFRGCQH